MDDQALWMYSRLLGKDVNLYVHNWTSVSPKIVAGQKPITNKC